MTNEKLVQELVSGGYLKSPLLTEAFRAIDRKDFVPEEFQESAYVNAPLPIGFGQTISQPLTVAFMMELLEPHPEEVILDIGVGSGWQTAMLAYIVGKNIAVNPASAINAKVLGIERIPELKAMAEKNIAKYGFIEKGIVELVLGNAIDGVAKNLLPAFGFNKIIAAASAEKEIPIAWKRQLAVDGRIVAPAHNSIIVLEKRSNDVFIKKEYPGFTFVPLVRE